MVFNVSFTIYNGDEILEEGFETIEAENFEHAIREVGKTFLFPKLTKSIDLTINPINL